MKDLNIAEFPINEFEVIFSMAGALDRVAHDINSICYTVYYYLEYQSSDKFGVKSIAVNGINPTRASISDRSYPYVAEVYAVIRTDLNELSLAYKIYEWLQTENGRQVIGESGYIPN
jgi:phosphate transport system substrate-binding protein